MNTRSSAVIAALLLTGAQADFNGAASAVSQSASSLENLINNWSSNDGLVGALKIQQGFGPLSNAVGTLSQQASGVSDNDLSVDTTNALGSAISGLLKSLTDKAADLKSVHADSIVSSDVSSIQSPTVAIVSDIVNAVKGDCDKVKSLTSALDAITSGFSNVNAAYGVKQSTFPKAPSC